MKYKFSLAILLLLPCVAKAQTLTLEHEFDGYYTPFNFMPYTETDDERYFYPMIHAIKGNEISLLTYNEDYSVKDEFNCVIPTIDGYTPNQISFSSSLKLTDGTPFYVVAYQKTGASLGSEAYTKSIAYNLNSG